MRPLAPLELAAAIREVREAAAGSRVENIYRTGAGILIKLSRAYLAATRFRVSLTAVIPEKTHQGAETLRGLFRGGRLVDARMPRFDRLAVLEFDGGSLVAELLEPFNLVAVREGRAVWVLHGYRGKDREVRPGAEYRPPPQVFLDLLKAGEDEIAAAIDPGDPARSLRRMGLGPEWSQEVLARAGSPEPAQLARAVRSLVDEVVSGPLAPGLCVKAGVPVWAVPVQLRSAQCDEVKPFEAYWRALDALYSQQELEAKAREEVAGVEARRRRLEASLKELEAKAREYKEKAAELKAKAHRLLMYKYDVEEALEGRDSSIRVVHVDARRALVETPEGSRVEIDRGRPVGRQIEEMFQEAKRLEEKAARASEAMERLRRELADLERAEAQRLEAARAAAKVVAERAWFERFRWTLTAGRSPVLGGRDASQNEALVRRYLKRDYLFFHADIPGAAVVLAPPLGDPLEVLQVAQFAAAYSRAWRAGIHAIDVYYAKGEQVSKGAPSGEYLAKGSFMVYGRREYVRHVRLELAVGFRRDGGAVRAVAAPPRSIGMLAERYVVLTPGGVDKGKVAGELARRWGVPQEELLPAIPGPSRIQEAGEGSPLPWEEVEAAFARW